MEIKQIFIEAINNKKIIIVTIDSYEKGTIIRKCIPFDYGPSRKFKDGSDRYHFYTLNSPEGNHLVSILPQQVLKMELTDETFNPGDFISWRTNWFLKRDWGKYS